MWKMGIPAFQVCGFGFSLNNLDPWDKIKYVSCTQEHTQAQAHQQLLSISATLTATIMRMRRVGVGALLSQVLVTELENISRDQMRSNLGLTFYSWYWFSNPCYKNTYFCNSAWFSPSRPWRFHTALGTWRFPPASKVTQPGTKTTYTGGTCSWKTDLVFSCSVLVDFDNPEKCQETCQADPACVGFTLVSPIKFVLQNLNIWNLNIRFWINFVRINLTTIVFFNLASSRRWTTENSDVISLACVLFSSLGQENPCQNCISGQK